MSRTVSGPFRGDTPHAAVADLSDRYLSAVLAGDRERAAAVIGEGLTSRFDAATLLGQVLGAAQREIGERWQRQELTVLEEHRATELTREEVERIRLARRPPRELPFVAVVCAGPGEVHALPARLFATLLDCRGWQVDFLGQAPPQPEIESYLAERYLAERRPHLFAMSITIDTHLDATRELCRAISTRAPRPRILLGGQAVSGRSAESLSADAVATDAAHGLQLAADLVGATQTPDLSAYLGTIGRRVHRLRRESGLSQEKLAERCGLARPYLGAIERGRQNITLDAALRIAGALGISMTDLLGD
ncbi:MAG: helix-turn-helix domain-containing protein [Acidobacteriota bacterium]